MAFEPDPIDESTYVPTVDDEMAGEVDAELPEDQIPDTSPNVGDEDEPEAEETPVESEDPEVPSDFQPGDWTEDIEVPDVPAFIEEYPDSIPLEHEEATAETDDDEGDIYSVSTGSPTDEEWDAVEDGDAPVVAPAMFAALAVEDEVDPGSLTGDDFEVVNETVDIPENADLITPVQYEIQGKPPAGEWATLATVAASEFDTEVAGLPTEQEWLFRVRAVFSNGEVSEWSAETAVELPGDMLAPPTPSTPTVTAQRGVWTISWDGLGVGAKPQPADYKFTIVWTSESGEDGTWNAIGTVSSAGDFMWSGGDYNVATYFALSSLDTHGNSSARSAFAMAIMKPLVEEPDIQAELDRIDEETGGLITESRQLNDRLALAEKDLNAAEEGLAKLRDVDIPAMDKRLSDADIAIRDSQSQLGTKLSAAETELAGHKTRLGNAETSLNTLNNTTLPKLQSDLDTAEASLGTLTTRIGKAETELNTSKVELNKRLDTAFSQIVDADGKAQTAVNMAGSKSQVFYGTGIPTATSPAAGRTGDLFRRLNSNSDIIAEYQWNGSSWVSQQITTAAISNLDLGKLTAGTAAINELVVEKLWADVIRARKIMADQVMIGSGSNLIADPFFNNEEIRGYRHNSSTLAGGYGTNSTLNLRWYGGAQSATSTFNFYFHSTPGRDTPDAMFTVVDGDTYRFKGRVNAVGGKARWNAREYLKDGTFRYSSTGFGKSGYYHSGSSGQIMEDTYTPSDLVAAFIPYVTWEASTTTAHVYGGASVTNMADGNLIVAGSITGDHVDANSVAAKVATVIQLNADRIAAGTINTARLNTDAIAAATAAIQKADIKNLTVSNGTFSTAVIDKLWADVISARKITADQIYVGQGENLIPYDVTSGLPGAHENFQQYGGGSATNPSRQIGAGVADGNHLYKVADWVTAGADTLTWRIGRAGSGGISTGYGIPVEPGEELYGSMYVKAGGSYTTYPNVRMGIYWYNAAGTYLAAHVGEATLLNWVWTKIERSAVAPATAAYALIYVRQDQPGGVRVDLPALYRKKGGNLIVTGSITASHIDSKSVSAEVGKFIEVDVSQLKASSATISTAVIEKLWADVIHAKKITTDMLIIGAGSNLVPNGTFLKDVDGWSGANIRWGSANGPTPTTAYGYVTTSDTFRSSPFEVEPGGDYRLTFYANASTSTSRIYAQLMTDGSSSNPYLINNQALTTGWVKYTATVKIAADVQSCYLRIFANHTNGTVAIQRFTNMSFVQMSDGELIVDGAITAGKIATNAVTAGKIAANAITADKIDSGAVTAIKIAGQAITADKLHAAAITGKTISGGTITGATLSLTANSYEVNVNYDSAGAYLGFQTPRASGVRATIRAHENPASEDPAQLVIKAPNFTNESERAFLSVTSESPRVRGVNSAHASLVTNSDLVFTRSAFISSGGPLDLQATSSLGNTDLRLSADTSQGAYVQSTSTYARTYSGSAAMCITGSGVFGRVTSALKYKQDVETVDTASYEDALLSIDHKSWVDKGEAERYANYLAWETEHPLQPIPASMLETPTCPPKRHYGSIADEFHDAGLTQFVQYDVNGEVEGLAYERIGSALIPIVRKQRDRIADLESKLEALMARVDLLEAA